jgi:hypothetical protein
MKNGSQGPGIETIVNKEKIPHVPEKPSPIAFNCQGVISCKHLVQRIIQKSSLKIYLHQPIRSYFKTSALVTIENYSKNKY